MPRAEPTGRADAVHERDELRHALDERARALEESRDELRGRAERAERELDRLRGDASGEDTGENLIGGSRASASPKAPDACSSLPPIRQHQPPRSPGASNPRWLRPGLRAALARPPALFRGLIRIGGQFSSSGPRQISDRRAVAACAAWWCGG